MAPVKQQGKLKAREQILTVSPLGPCSPLKPAMPGSPCTKEKGRFSHGGLCANPPEALRDTPSYDPPGMLL